MRYIADARLRRVARIVGNQIQRLAAYLRTRPPVAGAQAQSPVTVVHSHHL
jgi:hypothetical protein